MSLSLHEDFKLKMAENAWKPRRLEADGGKSDQEKDTEKFYKEVRGILNKLTAQKFDTLMKKFMHLPINSEERLVGVIGLIFDKAVDEPNFSKAYANMCKICSKLEVSKIENGQEQKVNFRKILITRCQTEFESNKSSELDAAKWLEEIKNCTDPEHKKELQLQYEEKERLIQRKSVGNIRFIGELFKLGMLTPAIMYRCIEHFLSTPEEESLECLCALLTTIGKDLEYGQHPQKQPFPGTLNPYFQRMSDLAQKKEGSKVLSRVRFMLQDVIELRQNKWVPRREDNNPKTIEQITKEAERISFPVDSPHFLSMGGGINRSDNDGWVSVLTAPSSRYHSKAPAFEVSKMQNMVKSLHHPPPCEPSNTGQVSMDEIQGKMIRLMLKNTPCDKMFHFISVPHFVGDRVGSLEFIRAFITAICTACLTDSKYPSWSLDLARFKEYEKLIQRYVDNKEDRELACLSSVHILSNRLYHPLGLIVNIFNLFLENNIISRGTFLKWKEDDSEKLENKGVSLNALMSFFAALEETKSKSLEYLTGEPPQYEPSSASQLSMDEVQDKMIRLMQTNTPCDKIFQFISSNVGVKVESLHFIRALITAICTACITDTNSLDLARFKEYEKLIQRYVDNKEDRQLACLSSVHILINRLDHPQGLIKTFFNLFLDNYLITCDSFLKWKDDDTEELENKGVSLYALTSFFSALQEVKSEDENF